MLEGIIGLLVQSNGIVLDNLLEILLSIILMFNVGAFTFLWRKMEEQSDEFDSLEEKVSEIESVQDGMWNRFYGHEDDDTSEGHLMETQERFQELNDKLESISDNLKEARKERKKEHEEVNRKISSIIWTLDREEDIDIDKEDIHEED